uniref:Uncharacterized protein n=1 Tax=Panagrolaimus sp. ES5 TaxID=591445 RepID=A0AC34G9Z2_9BILA
MLINSQLLLLCVGISIERGYGIHDILLSISHFLLSLYVLYTSRDIKPEHFDPNLMFPSPPEAPNNLLADEAEFDWDSDSTIESNVDSAFSSESVTSSETEAEEL